MKVLMRLPPCSCLSAAAAAALLLYNRSTVVGVSRRRERAARGCAAEAPGADELRCGAVQLGLAITCELRANTPMADATGAN
eukprot:COSAG02_NODE_46587_length_347_cov_1.258065_1_plen_81_part_01